MKELHLSDIEKELETIAPLMNAQRRSRFARPRYHLLADALFWTDEIPEGISEVGEDALRFILRYRTSLLMSNPQSEFELLWRTARNAFPEWAGFSLDRCIQSEHLKAVFLRLQAKSMKR